MDVPTHPVTQTSKSEIATIAQTGPPLPETLQLLAPLAPTLEKLNLGGNKLSGAITDDIAVFTKLTELALYDTELHGAWDGCSNSS